MQKIGSSGSDAEETKKSPSTSVRWIILFLIIFLVSAVSFVGWKLGWFDTMGAEVNEVNLISVSDPIEIDFTIDTTGWMSSTEEWKNISFLTFYDQTNDLLEEISQKIKIIDLP